jgi:hypothetical protein
MKYPASRAATAVALFLSATASYGSMGGCLRGTDCHAADNAGAAMP